MKQRGFPFVLKRALDLGIAGLALAAAAPVLAVAAAAILISDGAPVFFRQERPGRGARLFVLVKFRTMRQNREQESQPQYDADRLTRVGKLLRKSSIDEIPQLWNVLCGEMSLVGPRPLLVRYLPRYSPEQARRHEVMPGMTGWSQINGRNALSWDEKLALDVWYVDHWSPLLDLKIMCLTLARLLRPAGISNAGHVTMPEFFGSASERAGRVSA